MSTLRHIFTGRQAPRTAENRDPGPVRPAAAPAPLPRMRWFG